MKNKEQIHIEYLKLLEPINDSLYIYAYSLTKNKLDAEDLISEVILKTYEKFRKNSKIENFKAYSFIVLRNIFFKKKFLNKYFTKMDNIIFDKLQSNDYNPEINAEISILYKALLNLEEKHREAVILFEIVGFSIKEICKIQKSSESAVKSRIKRGREKLKELLFGNEIHTKIKDSSKILE